MGSPIWQYLPVPERHLRLAQVFPDVAPEIRDRGDAVVRQGDEADGFYILLSGEASMMKSSAEVAQLRPRRYFGEIGLLNSCPRTATVEVVGDGQATLISTGRESFLEMLGGADGNLTAALLGRLEQA